MAQHPLPRYLLGLMIRILAAVLIGAVLLVLVYWLPVAPMDRNLGASVDIFQEEGAYPEILSWWESHLDNTTDANILMNAAYDSGEFPLIQAMYGKRGTGSGQGDPVSDLIAHYAEGKEYKEASPYGRYWHGYLLYVKPALLITGYRGIRIVNGLLQLALLAAVCLLLHRRDLKHLTGPYLLSMLFLMPLASAMSLQFSSCYYVFTLGTLAVLTAGDALPRREGYLFAYIGIATAYFDFLTYPIATLGIPAAVCFCLRRSDRWQHTFCRGVKLCFSWGVGYVGMWAGKWVLGSLITGSNLLADASSQIALRSSANVEADESLLRNVYVALSANIKTFLRTPATVLLALLVLVFLVLLGRALASRKVPLSRIVLVFFPFVVLALLPPAWYAVTTQHSIIHYWFTCKGLTVSVFAGLCALSEGLRLTKE